MWGVTDSYNIPALVVELYDVFSKFDILDDDKNFQLKWWGCTIIVHVGTISSPMDIILSNRSQIPQTTEECITKVSANVLSHVIVDNLS